MSIVGPRPLLVKYLPRYSAEQHRRHDVRPGRSGRNAISWEEKFALDVEYVDRVSFFLDIKIVFLTVVVVFRRSGIHSSTSETQEEFLGTKEETVMQ